MTDKKFRVLYFNNQGADYLADCVLTGLLQQPGVEVSQYPLKKILYKKYAGESRIRGKGFTLYHQFEDNSALPANPDVELTTASPYDLIVFSSIQRQFEDYKKYRHLLKNKKVWILDGEDTPAMYPYHGYFWWKPSLWFLPKAHTQFLYFKREWTPETLHYLRYKLMPRSLSKLLPAPRNLRPISFSIPASKILHSMPEKKKLFPLHIVDEEVASKVEGSFTGYVFESESDYYTDIQQSKFGITTKRSGWDCLRHYEIAANRAVICFRDLDKKPATCAPHGLLPNQNCISYSSYEDLLDQINGINADRYTELQQGCFEWVKQYSCENLVRKLIE